MSTRRTTRAGSRTASSTGARSVGPEDIPPTPQHRAPGRPRKIGGRSKAGDDLAPISGSGAASTAYGINTIRRPAATEQGAPLANDISNVINGLLEPTIPSRAPSEIPALTPGGPGTPAAARTRAGSRRRDIFEDARDRSFQNESGIYDNASINSSFDGHYQRFSGPADLGEVRRREALQIIAEEQQQHLRGGQGGYGFGDEFDEPENVTSFLKLLLRS